MKRVLVTGAANIGKAGVATIVYKWGQEFDSDKLVYDYLMQRGLPDQKYVNAIENKGSKIYTFKGERKNLPGIVKWVERIVRENHYETIHINTDTAYIAAAYIYAARRGGIRHIFVHSHCTQVDDNDRISRIIKTVLHKVCMRYVIDNSEKYLACSKLAGCWMFGKRNVEGSKYQTIYNGVKVESYFFREQTRNDYRKQMGLDRKFVIGNIGRFSYQKNHKFLLKVFNELSKINDDAVLVLVGAGELESEIKSQANILNISDKVVLLGTRNDVPALLSMFDVLVMPSRFEGLPVTMVEAQMADLPCVVSGNITREAKFTESVDYVEGFDTAQWVQTVNKYRNFSRVCKPEEKKNSYFNIDVAAKELEQVLIIEE